MEKNAEVASQIFYAKVDSESEKASNQGEEDDDDDTAALLLSRAMMTPSPWPALPGTVGKHTFATASPGSAWCAARRR